MDPQRRYRLRPGRGAQFGTPPRQRTDGADRSPGRLRPRPALTYGPLLGSPRRGRWRSRLLVATVVLLVIALLAFVFIFAHIVFPQ